MVRFESADDAERELAPVVYLPGAAPGMKRRSPLEGRSPVEGRSRADVRSRLEGRSRLGDDPGETDHDGAIAGGAGDRGAGDRGAGDRGAGDAAVAREQAEKLLLTRLRRRSISVAEANTMLTESGLDASDADLLVERFVALGYLDDARLAEQVVHSHHDRKGLGRSGVEAEMRRRKIPAEVILQTFEEVPDDEDERAAELARSRAAQLARYDDETIERRLTGFLMRKGYGSSTVRAAVRQAIQATRRPPGNSSVRFR